MEKNQITTLFLDIGKVLLSNGWDRHSREKAVIKFGLDAAEFSDRHAIFFETYETGKITLSEYLHYVVFNEPRNFSEKTFTDFIFSQSVAIREAIEYFAAVKKKYHVRVLALNNEGKEINEYRIRTFKLDKLFDAFITSCYVGVRKPDKDIFTMACPIAYTEPQQALFIDDRLSHVQVAESLGMNAILFESLSKTKKLMQKFGFVI